MNLRMSKKTMSIMAITAATAAAVGYMVYFDHQRRNDPSLRKRLKREKKKATKQAKNDLDWILQEAAKEEFPSEPADMEAYFTSQLEKAEGGAQDRREIALAYFLALLIYPKQEELLALYIRTIPQPTLDLVLDAKRAEYYKFLPSEHANVELSAQQVETTSQGQAVMRYMLMANKDLGEGETIYSETPLVSALAPCLEGLCCHLCMKKVDETDKVACITCDKVAFCSTECQQQAAEGRHASTLCEKGAELAAYAVTENRVYASMVAQLMTAVEKRPIELTPLKYSPWDHVDRLRYLETKDGGNEQEMVKAVLGEVSQVLTEEMYLMLKGKMLFNAYAVTSTINEEPMVAQRLAETPQPLAEHARASPQEQKAVGTGLYVLTSYLQRSADNSNTRIQFSNDYQLSVVTTKPIAKGELLLADYSLPV